MATGVDVVGQLRDRAHVEGHPQWVKLADDSTRFDGRRTELIKPCIQSRDSLRPE